MPRVVRFHELGGPEVLRLETMDTPEPGAGEVRLRVHAIGLNRGEIMFRRGTYVKQPTFPTVLGVEAAGAIEAIGAGVTGFAIGDRVSTIPVFDMDAYSLYGEVSLAPARALVRIPDNVSWETAAASYGQFGTAWGALTRVAGLKRGQSILIPAASSSVGLAAIQIANALGARPIALTRRSNKKAALAAAGAAAVVATEEQDLVAEVLKLTDGRGADIAFDPVGGPTFPKLVAATAPGGLIVLYGALSEEVTPLPMLGVVIRDVTIKGFGLPIATRDEVLFEDLKRFVNDGLQSGALKPVIADRFPLTEIVEAHRRLEANQHVGKFVVLT